MNDSDDESEFYPYSKWDQLLEDYKVLQTDLSTLVERGMTTRKISSLSQVNKVYLCALYKMINKSDPVVDELKEYFSDEDWWQYRKFVKLFKRLEDVNERREKFIKWHEECMQLSAEGREEEKRKKLHLKLELEEKEEKAERKRLKLEKELESGKQLELEKEKKIEEESRDKEQQQQLQEQHQHQQEQQQQQQSGVNKSNEIEVEKENQKENEQENDKQISIPIQQLSQQHILSTLLNVKRAAQDLLKILIKSFQNDSTNISICEEINGLLDKMFQYDVLLEQIALTPNIDQSTPELLMTIEKELLFMRQRYLNLSTISAVNALNSSIGINTIMNTTTLTSSSTPTSTPTITPLDAAVKAIRAQENNVSLRIMEQTHPQGSLSGAAALSGECERWVQILIESLQQGEKLCENAIECAQKWMKE
jgi:hypothetical protein